MAALLVIAGAGSTGFTQSQPAAKPAVTLARPPYASSDGAKPETIAPRLNAAVQAEIYRRSRWQGRQFKTPRFARQMPRLGENDNPCNRVPNHWTVTAAQLQALPVTGTKLAEFCPGHAGARSAQPEVRGRQLARQPTGIGCGRWRQHPAGIRRRGRGPNERAWGIPDRSRRERGHDSRGADGGRQAGLPRRTTPAPGAPTSKPCAAPPGFTGKDLSSIGRIFGARRIHLRSG